MQPSSPSGLKTIPQLQWGSHLAHFYTAGEELRDVLVPYFKAGLENNEQCLWVTGDGFNAEQARSALRAAVPDLDRRERGKQIEIANGGDWYSASERLRPDELVNGLLQSEQDALGRGFAGLRTSGNCAWVSHDQWADFLDYERLVQKSVRGRRLICFCSYCTDQLRDGVHWDVLERHDMALPHARPARRDLSNGAPIESTEKRLFDLAMTASQMGTWRYTLADNVCVYDENAQRLYGLTEARFLHDEEGVKSKFHPDDLELMWARVTKALDPQGDGRYDVDYRVRQLDGSWRWLSAWGLVEFEGDGREKNPVAITGASKDLTAQKRAEEAERLMRDELIHRVKNTLATVQAVAGLTLRAATDLPSASQALERRIQSMAQAHDLLTSRAWTAANLMDVVMRSVGPFTPAQIRISGPAIDVSAQHVLALSLAIHELATNAAKYGALSRPEGRVDLGWQVQDGTLSLHWEESGGPPVARPARKGFGSRLLENLVFRDRGGDTVLTYDPQGVRCHMTVPL